MTGLTRREFGSLLAAAPLAAASRMGEQPGSPPGIWPLAYRWWSVSTNAPCFWL